MDRRVENVNPYAALNPMDPQLELKPQLASPSFEQVIHPQQSLMEEDSAVTKAEKLERHGVEDVEDMENRPEESQAKRIKLEPSATPMTGNEAPRRNERQKGVAPIKAESVVRMRSMSDGLTVYQIPCISSWERDR